MINSSEPFGIDINGRDDEGETGFMKSSKKFGGCETVMLMLENHKKYGINIKQETFIWETALGLVGEDCSNQSEEDIKYIIQVLEEAYSASVNESQSTF